jgi:mitochondrial fission protein ELM1
MNNGLRLLIISDNKPGHVSGSMGVLKSMESIMPVAYETLNMRLRIKGARPLLKGILNSSILDRIPSDIQRILIRVFYKTDSGPFTSTDNFDWIVSAGGDTSFLNAWIARLDGTKNIYCSSLRGLNPELFTITTSATSTSTAPNNIRLKLAPAPISRKTITAQGSVFRAEQKLQNDRLWAVLIGGNGAGYIYSTTEMQDLANGLLKLARKNGAKLLITTSRRTGIKNEQVLEKILSNHPQVAYATFFNAKPEKVVAKYLGAAEVVFCTADSGSMITESMAAGKPLYLLQPKSTKITPFYRSFLQGHIDGKRLREIHISDINSIDIKSDTENHFELLEQDPITELAEKLKAWI